MDFEKRVFRRIDWWFLIFALGIPLVGLAILYSAGYDPEAAPVDLGIFAFKFSSAACLKQLCFLSIGIVIMALGSFVPLRFLYRYSFVLYAVGIALLLVVASSGIIVNGSRRWIDLGIFKLQPSECMKLGVLIVLARVLSKRLPRERGVYSLRELVVPAMWIVLPMALILQQPDLGTALSLGVVGVAQILFVGVRPRVLLGIVLTCCVLAYPAWNSLHGYQQRRIMVLLDPESDPQGSGYHITQSKIAVGSGELFGKGFREGTQTQLEFLPEHTTDFVFSVLAEEWGFLGCCFVLGLYFCLLTTMLRIANRTKEVFACLLVVGITTQIFTHLVVNIGMVIGLMPVVGIPLPLISYGGSSLLSLMFGLGLVHGISMRRGAF